MRIVFWASLLLLTTGLATASDKKLDLPSGKALTYSSAAECTRLVVPLHAAKSKVCLQRDNNVASNARPTLKLIAEVPQFLILTDTYPSIPGGMSYCQAGEETFLRVIALRGKRARETYHRKLASCRQNIELADPGVTWAAESGTLTIHWLSGPKQQGSPETETLVVDKNAVVKQQ
ncbi:MAG TPA: hypothetical protein VMU05_09650 [Dongiaceae bacterium]|nr:hypothetical protein [Dongiaceae bacterium]